MILNVYGILTKQKEVVKCSSIKQAGHYRSAIGLDALEKLEQFLLLIPELKNGSSANKG
jgi:hypothetical protein